MPKLDGKVAIATGAGSNGVAFRTGEAISLLFAREGARVVLVDASEDRPRDTLDLIRDEGGHAAVVAVDLAAESAGQRVVDFPH